MCGECFFAGERFYLG